jgi:hypothetical protein
MSISGANLLHLAGDGYFMQRGMKLRKQAPPDGNGCAGIGA